MNKHPDKRPLQITDDAVAKAVMGDPRRADGVLRVIMPPEVEAICIGLPEIISPDMQDARLRRLHLDLFYRYPLDGHPAENLYIPLEHKLQRKKATPMQQLGYYMAIAEEYGEWRRGLAITLPLVMPVLLCNGPVWRRPPALADLIPGDGPIHRSFTPLVPMYILHTSDLTREQLPNHLDAWAGLATMTHGGRRRRMTEQELAAILPHLPTGSRYETQLAGYLVDKCAHNQQDAGMMAAVMNAAKGNHRGDDIMGFVMQQGAIKGRAEGMAAGMAEGVAAGIAEGKASTLTDLLQRKFGRVPRGAKGLIAKAKPPELDAWLGAMLTAESPRDIFGERLR